MSQSLEDRTPTLRRRSIRILMLCTAMYLLACLGCVSFQRRLIYFPTVCTAEKADEFAKSEKLERWQSPVGKSIGWKRLASVQPAQGQVLITHGNAGCAYQCSHYADVIQTVASFDIFIVEYPGYADRPGLPSENNIDEAAAGAFQLIPTNSPIYLVGRYPDKVAGLVLFAPYNRLADVAQAHMRIFPVRWLLRERFPSEDHLRSYSGQLAVLVAGQDTVVPQKFGRRLYDGYAGPKRLWEFPQATHDDLMDQPPEVWKQIVSFWQTER
jgi:hypothetical protein